MILRNFIVFEGIDGSGTSTQMKILGERLEGKKIWLTNEPTGNETGKLLRNILRAAVKADDRTVAHLFAADRCEHLYGRDGIYQKINEGATVFCDRYLFSSLAYQSHLCGEELVLRLNRDFPLPEYTFFFDLDPEISLKRIEERSVKEIYEHKDFLEKTRAAYQNAFSLFENRTDNDMTIIRINAAESVESVSAKIWSSLKNLPIMKV